MREEPKDRGPAAVLEQFHWAYGAGTEDSQPVHDDAITDYVKLGSWVTFGHLTGGFARHSLGPVTGRNGRNYHTLAAEMTRERGYWEAPETKHGLVGGPAFMRTPTYITTANEKALAKLIRLTQENDIALLIRLAPVIPGSSPRNDGRFVDTWAKELEERHANVTFSRSLMLYFDVDCFADVDHCNRTGAEKLTARTAEEVRQLLAGRR